VIEIYVLNLEEMIKKVSNQLSNWLRSDQFDEEFYSELLTLTKLIMKTCFFIKDSPFALETSKKLSEVLLENLKCLLSPEESKEDVNMEVDESVVSKDASTLSNMKDI
jgi:hypothetical protein